MAYPPQSYSEYTAEDPPEAEKPGDDEVLSELRNLLRGKSSKFQMDWLEPFIEETIIDDPLGDGDLVIFIERPEEETDFSCNSAEPDSHWNEPWSSGEETLFEYFMEQYIDFMKENLKEGDSLGLVSLDLEYLSSNG
ncbi:MAG: hypothetical protein CL398_07360 [Acidiferrobacteraceae bacterium]|nr:hypothetical protein [Acidiferrobacteraceae bacterium]|tara:strand:+ start:185 stop:595 length:411 start_codon:yes stop_codon:yes gene_type:complete